MEPIISVTDDEEDDDDDDDDDDEEDEDDDDDEEDNMCGSTLTGLVAFALNEDDVFVLGLTVAVAEATVVVVMVL